MQCSYCQGLMASSSRICHTVVRPMGLPSSSCARLARSVVDWRLKGLPVRATTSQAMDTTTALSRGGKDGLAASSCSVFQGKVTFGPALCATGAAVGGKVEPGLDRHSGERGGVV